MTQEPTTTDLEFTARYEGSGPDVTTMCLGQCEGMGLYPVNPQDPELNAWEAQQIALKREAGEAPDEIGHYFIPCPDCGGTGRRPERSDEAFPVGQRVTVIATRPHVHDTSDGEDVDALCSEPGVVVEQLLNDPHHDYLVYVPRTRRVYACVPADLAELEPPAPQSQALRDVIDERARQVSQEGWTPAHDDGHAHGQLVGAAICYALTSIPDWMGRDAYNQTLWPWAKPLFKPTTPRRDLVKAAALILAEIERLDRLEARHD